MKNENNKIQVPNVDREYTRRLADDLLSSQQADLILLNAGAGYGKTQALANYVRQFTGKSAWYSLSATDNDLMSFIRWKYQNQISTFLYLFWKTLIS